MSMWVISNRHLSFPKSNDTTQNHKAYSFFSDKPTNGAGKVDSPQWLFDGHILPRQNEPKEFSNLKPENLPGALYEKYGDKFIHHLKGNFTLIQLKHNSFNIYSDRFGIKKFFYWQDAKEFIISNDLKEITKRIHTEPSVESMAIYALVYHFIDGTTFYKNIFTNKGGQVLEFKEGKLGKDKYWEVGELLQQKKRNNLIRDIADTLNNNIESYLNFYPSDQIFLSLTAGVDSRLLLSALLNNNSKFQTYTYGNRDSIDCVFAKKIAKEVGLIHEIYDVKFNEYSIEKYVRKSIRIGQSISSLHRAHRVKAIEQVSKNGDTMFIGTMGGEFVKGANHDDYIISNFVYEFSENPSHNTLIKYLKMKGINIEIIDIEFLLNFFKSQSWCEFPELTDYYGLFEIAAGLHHAQNDIQYHHYFKNVFTPFLDIDYLEILFQSDYHFLTKKKYYTSIRRRLDNPKFAFQMQNILMPELTTFPYNSGFLAEEYNLNPIYAAIISRFRKKIWNFRPNFLLGNWMEIYVKNQLEKIYAKNFMVNKVFDILGLIEELNLAKSGYNESFWLKYTTPIQMQITSELFS